MGGGFLRLAALLGGAQLGFASSSLDHALTARLFVAGKTADGRRRQGGGAGRGARSHNRALLGRGGCREILRA